MEKPAQFPAAPSTTFVHADTATFKDLVQRLTGLQESDRRPTWPPPASPCPSSSAPACTKLSRLKRLHERRRQGSRLRLAIPRAASLPAMNMALASPSAGFSELDINNARETNGDGELNEEEEERAIKERRFYLHPSPRSRARAAEPTLLPLFPLTSPEAYCVNHENCKNIN